MALYVQPEAAGRLADAARFLRMTDLATRARTPNKGYFNITDPVGAGFVASMARPGGNATGFTLFEYGISAKWLEVLKEVAPTVTRALVLRDPALTSAVAQFAVMQSAGPLLGVELSPVAMSGASEIEATLAASSASECGTTWMQKRRRKRKRATMSLGALRMRMVGSP